MHFKAIAIVIAGLLVSSSLFAQTPTAQSSDSTKHRSRAGFFKPIRGWKVHNDPSMKGHRILAEKADSTLNFELGVIEQRIPGSVIGELKEIPIWLSLNSHSGKVLHLYQSAANWAKSHQDLDPRIEGSIEIQAPDYVNMPHDSLPLLKWMAYAYHQQSLGLHNQQVAEAFQHAKSSRIYRVQINEQQHFPFKNHHDYFAVLSEAYFGGPLSYAPFDKARLKQMDPQGYEMIEELWKVK